MAAAKNGGVHTEPAMSPNRRSPRRPLRRLRRALVLVGALTAVLVLVASRLETMARAVTAIAAFACLIGWLALLEVEGRAAERLETQARRRTGRRLANRAAAHKRPVDARRRAA